MKSYIKPHLFFIAFLAIILVLISLYGSAQNLRETPQSIYGNKKESFLYSGIGVGFMSKINSPTASLICGVKSGDHTNVELFMVIPVTNSSLAPRNFGVEYGYQISHFKPFIGAAYQTIGAEREAAFKGTPDQFLNGWRLSGGISYYSQKVPLYFTLQQLGKYTNAALGIYVTF